MHCVYSFNQVQYPCPIQDLHSGKTNKKHHPCCLWQYIAIVLDAYRPCSHLPLTSALAALITSRQLFVHQFTPLRYVSSDHLCSGLTSPLYVQISTYIISNCKNQKSAVWRNCGLRRLDVSWVGVLSLWFRTHSFKVFKSAYWHCTCWRNPVTVFVVVC